MRNRPQLATDLKKFREFIKAMISSLSVE